MSQHEERYQKIVQALTQMVWTTDGAGLCDYLSPQWVAYTGIPEAEQFGIGWQDQLHPDDRKRVHAAWAVAVDAASTFTSDVRIRRSDGAYRWFVNHASPEFDEAGQVVRWYGSSTDIHELRHNREQLREVLDYALDASFRRNLQIDRYDYISPVFGQITGYPQALIESWSAADVLALIHPEDIARTALAFQESASRHARNRYELEYRLRHHDGHYVWIRCRFIVMRDADGNALARVGSLANVTEIKAAEQEAHEAEFRSRRILDSLFAFVGLFSLDGVLLEANRAPLEAAGLSRDEVIGRPFADTYWWNHSPEAQAQVRSALSRAAAGNTVREDFQVRVADGRIAAMDATFSPLYDDQGRVTQVVGSGVDVTDRVQAEVALIESEERFRSMIDSSPVPCALNHEQQNILYLNPAFIRTFGWDLTDIPTLSDWWPRAYPDPSYRQFVAQDWRVRLAEAESSGRPFSPLEVNVRAKDGTERTAITSATRLADSFTGVHLVTLIDISDRRRTERVLEETQARLSEALDQARLAYWEMDDAGGAFIFNDRFYALYGTTAESEGGYVMPAEVYFREFTLPEEQRGILAKRDAFEAGDADATQMEHRVRRRDGVVRHMVVRISKIRDAAGVVVGTRGVNQDITERKKAAAEVAELEAQLHQSQKMEAVGTLAGGVAHDFNNILGSIIGSVTLAEEDLDPAHPVRQSLEQIAKSSRRAADLVKQLLAISRPAKLDRHRVHLPTLVRDDAPLLRALLPARVALTMAVDADVPDVVAHPTEVHQVLLNLCTNAAHAMDGSGTLTVSLAAVSVDGGAEASPVGLMPGRYARLTVEDNGSGMDEATIGRIFDPFFTTKEVGHGTGLGMTVVHRIMTSLRGVITVSSVPGQGTAVALYFPEAPANATGPVTGAPKVDADGAGRRVLFVDDEEMLVHLGIRILERRGYRVTGFSHADAAVVAFHADPQAVDALVVDFNMPGATGLDVAKKIRAVRPDLPVVLASGRVTDAMEVEALAVGVTVILPKPYTAAELSEAVAVACGVSQGGETRDEHGQYD